ncbi:MAG TPA: hypothetical protein VEC11_17165 [Allosphingosinicella sp.]|nr:hypothetical protein [Allosphingosinicella sp.]
MRIAPLFPALIVLAACSGEQPADNKSAAPASPAANAATPATSAGPAAAPDPLADYLPTPGRHAARAMALAPPAEAVALRDRMAAAILRNRTWYETYAAQHPQGELPWHANLGIGEADYRRYLALTRQIGLGERGRVTLTVTRRSDGGLALGADGAAAALDGLILYPDRGRVETPLGRLGTRAATGNDAPESPLGRWQGIRWSNEGTGAPRQLSLSAGRRADGERLLYYNYGPSDAETVILLYPAGPAR